MKIRYLVLGFFSFIILVLGLTWLATGNEFFLYKVFAPRRAAVQREVFEESKSYNQGMIQELQNMQFAYVNADPEHKAALASIILHRSADYPEDKLPSSLRAFISDLKRQRLQTK